MCEACGPETYPHSTHPETALPRTTVETLQLYVEAGIPPGNFLGAVLEHDLFEAVNRADSENLLALTTLVRYIWNHCPVSCHGSPEVVKAWIECGGLGTGGPLRAR